MSYKSELMEMTSGVETQIGKRSKVDSSVYLTPRQKEDSAHKSSQILQSIKTWQGGNYRKRHWWFFRIEGKDEGQQPACPLAVCGGFLSSLYKELLIMQTSEAHINGPGLPHFIQHKPGSTQQFQVLQVKKAGSPIPNLCPYQSLRRSNAP